MGNHNNMSHFFNNSSSNRSRDRGGSGSDRGGGSDRGQQGGDSREFGLGSDTASDYVSESKKSVTLPSVMEDDDNDSAGSGGRKNNSKLDESQKFVEPEGEEE